VNQTLPPALFSNFYKEFWKDRWEGLEAALQQPVFQVARQNRFALDLAGSGEQKHFDKISPAQRTLLKSIQQSSVRPIDEALAEASIARTAEGQLQYYIMDPASIFAAESLRVAKDSVVLDLCAAPGGKTLILAEGCLSESASAGQNKSSGELIANEYSKERRERLTQVLQQYIPRRFRDRLWVNGKDGLSFGNRPSKFYDRILVDAPCSGERYLLESSEELAKWAPSRSQSLMRRQYGLLTAAFESLAEGGYLVYSTCSLSPLENEEVLRKLLKKREGRFRFCYQELYKEARTVTTANPVTAASSVIEEWEFGLQVLPDRTGAGPIRWTVLQKT